MNLVVLALRLNTNSPQPSIFVEMPTAFQKKKQTNVELSSGFDGMFMYACNIKSLFEDAGTTAAVLKSRPQNV